MRLRQLGALLGFCVVAALWWLAPWRLHFEHDLDVEETERETQMDGSRVLLVSAYFPLAGAKHSADEYSAWLALFLSQISSDLVFYAPPSLSSTVRALRSDLPLVALDTRWASPFEIPPLRNRRKQIEDMHELDREKGWHSAGLYAVWAAKPFFVREALRHAQRLGKEYDYVFWVDCGSFRGPHAFRSWPARGRVDEVFRDGARASGYWWWTRTRESELILLPIQFAQPVHVRHWNESLGPVDVDLSEGSFFGGSPGAVTWWARAYYTYFFHYADRGIFVGKDQTLINSLLFLFRDRIINVWYNDPDAPYPADQMGDCGDGWWYYYFFWLARPDEQNAQAKLWDKGGERCRIARVVSFADVLRRTYGRWWVGPKATLSLIEESSFLDAEQW